MTTQYGMIVDTTRCMGCQTCVVSCKISNEIAGSTYWGSVVSNDGDQVYRPTGTFPNVRLSFRPELCNHCAEPACVAVCPTGAMHKREEDGVVLVDRDVCIGCGTCVEGCPYGVPQVEEEANVSSKCHLCYERLAADKLPWCVQACPGEARIVGDLNDAESEAAKFREEKSAQPFHEEFGTNPSVYYV